jgi:DNA-binding transcriptional MerR regulator
MNGVVMLNIGEFARLGQVTPRMLRHYDESGLLIPERVDLSSGYRVYSVYQLGRLHRIVALRDIGMSLEQIGRVLTKDLSVDELRGMLSLRRTQIEQSVGQDMERLRRVEAHFRALEWSDKMELQDIVIKQTQPIRVAEMTARGLTQPEIGAGFARMLPQVLSHLAAAGASPGISVGAYEGDVDADTEGGIVLYVGFEVGDQDVPDSDTVKVVDLPVVEVAAAVYHGGIEGLPAAWESFVRWIYDGGYSPTGSCRELYHEFHDDDQSRNVTELQQPIAR